MNLSKRRQRVAVSRLPWTVFLHAALGLVIFLLAPGAASYHGQTFTASLSVTVTDPSSAAIPNVSLRLRNTDTNAVREAVTASDGIYVFSQVLPGNYELTAEAPGFRILTQRGITLLADHASSLSVVMQVGQPRRALRDSARRNRAVQPPRRFRPYRDQSARSPHRFAAERRPRVQECQGPSRLADGL